MNQHEQFADDLCRKRITRRQVLWLLGASAVSAASGCATSPVGGGSILVGMDEDEEKAVDRKVAPQQFSQDFGPVQDAPVKRAISTQPVVRPIKITAPNSVFALGSAMSK